MGFLAEEKIICPYCGELLLVLIDPSDDGQEYIEDCQICCRPITIGVASDTNGVMSLTVRSEDEL